MAVKRRFVIDFHVTGLCNLRCPFCCGTPKIIKGPDLADIKLTVNKLVKIGVTTIVLIGGEPLLRRDLPKIIRYIHDKGLEIYLSTNGLLLLENLNKIKKYINCLGLPLDGYTETISRKMGRDVRSYQAVLKILQYFKQNPPKFIVKLGTVVARVNKRSLVALGQLIFNDNALYHPDTWRLYQFSPLNLGARHRKKYEIKDREFNRICSDIQHVFPGKTIVPLSNKESNDSYLFVDPNLRIVLLTKDEFIEVADLKHASLEDLKKLKKQFQRIVSRGAFNRRWLSR